VPKQHALAILVIARLLPQHVCLIVARFDNMQRRRLRPACAIGGLRIPDAVLLVFLIERRFK
jgi:hypothetical protein